MQLNLFIAGTAVNEVNLLLEDINESNQVVFRTNGTDQEITFVDSVLWDSSNNTEFHIEWKLVEYLVKELRTRFQINFK